MFLWELTCCAKAWTYPKCHWLPFSMQIKKATSAPTWRSSRPWAVALGTWKASQLLGMILNHMHWRDVEVPATDD